MQGGAMVAEGLVCVRAYAWGLCQFGRHPLARGRVPNTGGHAPAGACSQGRGWTRVGLDCTSRRRRADHCACEPSTALVHTLALPPNIPCALQGGVDTSFIAEHESSLLERIAPGADELCLAALVYAAPRPSGEPPSHLAAPCAAPWRLPTSFRVNHPRRASVGFGHAPATGGLELEVVGAGDCVTLEGPALAEGSGLGDDARVEVGCVGRVTGEGVSA